VSALSGIGTNAAGADLPFLSFSKQKAVFSNVSIQIKIRNPKSFKMKISMKSIIFSYFWKE